ncbi:MAG: DUF308 domain-containing protein [Candidatus Woesearchaeota archaeon]
MAFSYKRVLALLNVFFLLFLGIVAFVWPTESLAIFVYGIALLLFSGAISLLSAGLYARKFGFSYAYPLSISIVNIILAILLIVFVDVFTQVIFILITAFFLLIALALMGIAVFRLIQKRFSPAHIWQILISLLFFTAGFLIITNPFDSTQILIRIIGGCIILFTLTFFLRLLR